METINAATIYGQVMAAAQVAINAAIAAGHTHKPGEVTPGDIRRAAVTAICADPKIQGAPEFLIFKTSARGTAKIKNCGDNLQAFAAKIKINAAAYGGGFVRVCKPRAAKTWAAGALKMIRELIEDHDYEAALHMADEKAGPLFFDHGKGVFMMLAPVDIAELPGFQSAMHVNGDYVVIEPLSGLSIQKGGRQAKNRAAAAQTGIKRAMEANNLDETLKRAQSKPQDQEAMRAAWMAAHGLVVEQSIKERIEARKAETEARRMDELERAKAHALATMARIAADAKAQEAAETEPTICPVAQVVAQAAAGAAIEAAQESAALDEMATQEVPAMVECATAEATQAVAVAPVCDGSDHANAPGKTPTAAPRGQLINSKSGNWSARFYTNRAGQPCAEFTQASGEPHAEEFPDGKQRMQWLQRMARTADDAATVGSEPKPTDYTDPRKTCAPDYTQGRKTSENEGGLCDSFGELKIGDAFQFMKTGDVFIKCKAGARSGRGGELFQVEGWRGVWKYDPCPTFKPENVDVLQLQTHEVQDYSAQEYADLLDYLTNINYHSERVMVCALRTGSDDLINEARALQALHMQQGGMGWNDIQTRRALQTRIDAALTNPTGTDYTNTRKTLGELSICITRAEGPSEQCRKPATVGSFAEADALLRTWSETAPAKCGYDKCDFLIHWPDGGTYEGRYDLKHHSAEKPSLSAHMVDQAEFYTGKNRPAHMSAAAYQDCMQRTTEEQRSTYADILAALTTLGVYHQKTRPVALDLRALVAAGVKLEELAGYGVSYRGDVCNASGSGAIVHALACNWYGVKVVVQLEDGREMTANASSFGNNAGDRYRLDFKQHGAPYMAQLAAAVASSRAQASSAAELEKQAHHKALQDLAAEFPQLKRAESHNKTGKLAAVNIRILLKDAFKGVKFSVTSDYNSVRVHWTDGPTSDQVNSVIGRFDVGACDTQSDYFYTVQTAFSELFGGVQYFSVTRELSDAAVAAVIAQAWPEAAGRPTVQDKRTGSGIFGWSNEHYWGREKFNQAAKVWTPQDLKS